MFIEQAYRARHEFWRYLIGSLVIIALSVVGQLPLGIAIILKSGVFSGEGGSNSMNNLMKSSDLSPNMFTFLILISFVFALLGIYLVVKYINGQTMKSIITTRKKIDWKRFFFSFSLIAIFIIVTTIIDYRSNPSNFVVNFKPVPFLILFVMAIILVPIQTSVEELVFRGYLMQGFGMLAKNRWFPLLLTSLIFGGLHALNPEVARLGPVIMFYYIGTGLFLGILALMDEGLELSLGFHAANNLIQILLVTATWTAFQSESVLKDISEPTKAGWETFFPLLVIYPIFLLIMAKVYRWKNWKEKLFGKIDPPPVEIENEEII